MSTFLAQQGKLRQEQGLGPGPFMLAGPGCHGTPPHTHFSGSLGIS